MTDLKPCPFCGSKNLSHFNDGYFIQIFCNACGARTGLFVEPDPERDKAVEAWNRRAETVEDQPAADVVYVRHGEWKDNNSIAYECSECESYLVIEQGTADMNYCPNCGAKMDGKVGDDNDSMESVQR